MSTTSLSDEALAYVCTLVRDRAAIELESSKDYLIEARLGPLAQQHGFDSTAELIHSIKTRRQPRLEAQVTEAMTTNETSFYRDRHPFDALRSHILPELSNSNSASKSLNIWSAACSTGQELYSIAMLIREHFPELASWRVDLLGTDLSDEVLGRARQGSFSQIEVNRGLPAPLLAKYFQRNGLQWQICPTVTEMASFRKLNLIEAWPWIPKMDVVFLRNVLIYFSQETKKEILKKVRRVMAPHAALFLGAAETTINLDDSFDRVACADTVYYRLR